MIEKGEGADPPLVVLLHGSMDRAASMARVARDLADHHVVRYDRRGYGRSRAAGGAGIDGHVDDLVAVVDGRPAVVFGHSYGGVVALAAAQRHPEVVVGVVAFEAPMPWRPWWPVGTPGGTAVTTTSGDGDPGDAAEAFLRRMLGDERWEGLPERTRLDRREEGVALVAEIASLRDGVAPYDPDGLTVPVVAGRGTRSPAHLMEAADVLADEVAGAELVVIEGSSHGCHLTHPREVARLVRALVARIRAA